MPRKPEKAKKRRNGAGSEWFDPERGLYFATYTRGLKPDGKPHVKRFSSSASQAAANLKRDADRNRWKGGVDAPAWMDRQTIGQFLRKRWLPSIRRGAETLRRYERDVRLHVDPDTPTEHSIGHVRLRELVSRPDLIDRLYRGLTPSVARNVHALLRVAFKRGCRWGDLPRDCNPCDLVDPPKYEAPEMQPPTAEQIVHFFACAIEADDPYLDEWFWLCDTGCRPGEMIGAEWPDIDAAGEWFVQRQRSTTPPAEVKPLKNKLRRRVQLTERLLARLRERRKRQHAQIARAGELWQDLNLVFANRTGGPLLWSNLTPEFKLALTRAKLPDFAPYVFFRHAHVTIGLAADVAVQDMSKRTGHSLEVLMRVYAHRVASRDQDAAAKWERATKLD